MQKSPLTKKNSPVVACDLFAGAGGFSLGAYNAGIDVAAAIEWDKHACKSYRENLVKNKLTDTKLFESDITTLSPAEVKQTSSMKELGCDILLGGPPCQGFSAHRINGAGIDDPRNALLLRYFEYVKVLRPTFFLVENVPGLLWPRHKKFLDAFYELAEEAGYGVLTPQTLNAKDYGVPQNRRRVFILGFDKKKILSAPIWPPAPTHVSPTSSSSLPKWKTASSVFSKPISKNDLNNIHMNHGPELIELFKRTPLNGGSRKDSGRVLNCHKNHIGHHDVYGRINPQEPGPTMTTACINPSKGRFVHPTEHHGITLRHAARFQTFPEWFIFSGGIISGGTQIGNAVPIDMATTLLKPLRDAVLELRNNKNKLKAA